MSSFLLRFLVIISNRLVSSPCAVVADTHGYTANVQKLMGTHLFAFLSRCPATATQSWLSGSSNSKRDKGYMHEFAMKAKFLEINPRSPLIEGLLRRVEQLPSEGEEKDLEAENELREITSILIDGALVRSGFEVPDSNGWAILISGWRKLELIAHAASLPGSTVFWDVRWVCPRWLLLIRLLNRRHLLIPDYL